MPLTAATIRTAATYADELLAAVVDAFSTASVDLPSRQYVHAGAIAHDCDQMVVSLRRIVPGDVGVTLTGDTSGQINANLGTVDVRTAVFDVQLLRCVPSADSQSPDPATLDAEADARIVDAQTLVSGIVTARTRGYLADCDRVAVGTCEAEGPQGGVAGWTVDVHIALL